MSAPRKKQGLILLAAFVGLLIIGALPRAMQSISLSKEWKQKAAEPLAISVSDVKQSEEPAKLSLPGTTQAILVNSIFARVDGYLKSVKVDLGSVVRKGQLIAEIDAPELDQQAEAAFAAVEQAKANLEGARQKLAKAESDLAHSKAQAQKVQTDVNFSKVQLKRYKMLSEQGAVSDSDRDQREQAFGAAEADSNAASSAIKAAEAGISSAQADVRVATAAVKSAEAAANRFRAMESFKQIVAPFDGTVTKKVVDQGVLISASSGSGDKELFEIANVDRMRIFVYVPEEYISYVTRGDTVGLVFQAYPALKFEGKVVNIAGGLDAATKALQVEVQLPNLDHKLMPGMYARVEFNGVADQKLAVIPATAVVASPAGPIAYSVDRANTIHLRKLDVARDLGGRVELLSGFNAGEHVVINPPDTLKEGMVVQPVAIAVKD